MQRRTLVTCGLPYANGPAHIGHLRTYIPADLFVRSLRKRGKDTTFVCGSDAHGTPIVINAEELGITPAELVQKYHDRFDESFKLSRERFLSRYVKYAGAKQNTGCRSTSFSDYQSGAVAPQVSVCL